MGTAAERLAASKARTAALRTCFNFYEWHFIKLECNIDCFIADLKMKTITHCHQGAELEKAQASVEAEESDRLKLAQSKVVAQKQAFAKRKADAKAQSRSSSVTNLDVERQVQRVGPGGRRVPMRQTAPVQRAPVGANRISTLDNQQLQNPCLIVFFQIFCNNV